MTFFEDGRLHGRVPALKEDLLILISASEEPKTPQVDALVAQIQSKCESTPVAIVGIGGGTLLDLAKAVAIMMTNTGSAADFRAGIWYGKRRSTI